MPTETKESLMRRIEELGEVMPKSATVLQLRARLKRTPGN